MVDRCSFVLCEQPTAARKPAACRLGIHQRIGAGAFLMKTAFFAGGSLVGIFQSEVSFEREAAVGGV